jgi:DeoR/GlpR family transcriptional regulator of sugar metabolism
MISPFLQPLTGFTRKIRNKLKPREGSAMLPPERKRRILSILKEHREVSIRFLADELDGLPYSTLSRDLRELEKEKRIFRRHGKVVFHPFVLPAPVDDGQGLPAKHIQRLAGEVVKAVERLRTFYIGSGALNCEIARRLKQKVIVTHDLTVMVQARSSMDNHITLSGREIDNESFSVKSSNIEKELERFHFQAVVLQAEGMDEHQIWVRKKDADYLEFLKNRMDWFIVIAPSACLGKTGEWMLCHTTEPETIFIDEGIRPEEKARLDVVARDLRVTSEPEIDRRESEQDVGEVREPAAGYETDGSSHDTAQPGHGTGADPARKTAEKRQAPAKPERIRLIKTN